MSDLNNTPDAGQTPVQNLNSLVDDGFDFIEDPEELQIEGKVFVAPEKDNAIDNNIIPSEKLFDSPLVEQELPKVQAEFEIHADKLDTLTELIKIQSEIKEKGLISVEDIAQVDAIIPGFVDEENPKELYTVVPTKTNLNQGLADIDTVLEKQYDDMRTSISDLIEQYMKMNSSIGDTLTKKFYKAVSDLNTVYAQLLFVTQKDDISQIAIILNNGMRLSKFLNTSISSCNNAISSNDSDDHNPYKDSFVYPYMKRIKDIDQENGAISLLYQFNNTSGLIYTVLDDLFKSSDDSYAGYAIFNYNDLYRTLMGRIGREAVVKMIDAVKENLSSITECKEAFDEAQSAEKPIALRIRDLTEVSSKVNQAVHQNKQLVSLLVSFYDTYQVFIDFFKDLTEKQKPVEQAQ